VLRCLAVSKLAITIAGVGLALTATAHAQPTAVELQARGEDLAKDNRFSEAIDAFKEADRLEVRASHACLIALAYTRRELWPQAEIWLDQCQKRAHAGDAVPEWGIDLAKQIQSHVDEDEVAAIELAVTPANVPVKIVVSSFAPDESFSPRTIHLPVGHHVVIATAPGYAETRRDLDVTAKQPQHVVLDMKPVVGSFTVATHAHASHSNAMVYAGGALLGAGVLTAGWMSFEYLKLKDAHDTVDFQQYRDHEGLYDVARYATIGLWIAGGALAITGALRHGNRESMHVSIAPTHDGGLVAVGWQR
jgi:hypothetical protein